MNTTDHLNAIRERANAATEGPWGVIPEGRRRSGAVESQQGIVADVESPRDMYADAEFIAHARTDLPRLLDAVEAVLEVLDILESPAPENWPSYLKGSTSAHRDAAREIRYAITTALEGK